MMAGEKGITMARKIKPCDFCETDQIFNEVGANGHQLAVEFYPDNNLFAVSSFSNDENGEAAEISADYRFEYCPRCGRKIGY